MSCVLALQRQRNAQSRDAWDSFAKHRARVMQLIQQCVAERAELLSTGNSPTSSTDNWPIGLAVLDAGNCNDLDMSRLTTTLAKVVLVDCDQQAVEQRVARQFPDPPANISIYAPCDRSGWVAITRSFCKGSKQCDSGISVK